MHGFERNEAGKIFVGGLSWDTTKESLLNYFSQYGEVVDCVVMKNPDTGKSRGFGFVTYRDPQCLETVLTVPAHIVDGRQVDPKACNPKGPQRGPPGMGGGGGGGGERGERGGHDGGPRMNRGGRGMEGMKDRKIFIGGLPSNADEEAIRNFFSKYGKVLEVTVMYDAQKQRSRGFGFMTLESEDAVNQVCREHYINFNGKKVECKRATPRDNRGGGGGPPQDEQQMHMPPQQVVQHLEMGNHPVPPQQGPGPVPVQDPNWAPPPEGSWGQQPQQGPPPPMGAPAQFQNVQFPGGYQGEPPQQGGWPQQPPVQAPGGWPPGGIPPPQQGAPAPVSAPAFVTQPSPTFSTTPAFQPPPAGGAPVYQWTTSPPAQQSPPSNGQAPLTAIGQSPAGSYAYAAPTYGSPGVASPHSAAGVPPRQYQEFGNNQVQLTSSVAPVQAPAPVPATTQGYSAYASPYVSPQNAGSAPPPDSYVQPAPVAPPQGAVQVAAPAPGQPTPVPGAYGNPVAPAPVAGNADPAAAAKSVDYSSYYSAYGYGAEANPAAAAGAYGAQPAPTPAPYGGQGDSQQAVAYGGAPGPSPTFQRQGSGSQGYHPYARR